MSLKLPEKIKKETRLNLLLKYICNACMSDLTFEINEHVSFLKHSFKTKSHAPKSLLKNCIVFKNLKNP